MSWWCSSPAKVASGEVGQQRRSWGHWGLKKADAAPELVARTLGPGGARPSEVSSPASGWRSAAGEASLGLGRLAGWPAHSRITVHVNSIFRQNNIFLSQQSPGTVFLLIFQSCRTGLTNLCLHNLYPILTRSMMKPHPVIPQIEITGTFRMSRPATRDDK